MCGFVKIYGNKTTLFFKRSTYNANYFKRSYCSTQLHVLQYKPRFIVFFLTQQEQLYILYFIPQI